MSGSGFRLGKVPMKVMKRCGAGVRQEVWGGQQLSFQEAVMSENSPGRSAQHRSQKNGCGQDVEYTATFEVFPGRS